MKVVEDTYVLGGSAQKCRSRSLGHSPRETVAAEDVGAVKQRTTVQMLLTRIAATLKRPGNANDFQFLRWAVTWMLIGSAVTLGMLGLHGDYALFQQDAACLRGGGRTADLLVEDPECAGRRVYIYDLPPQFNEEVMQRLCAWSTYADGFCSNGGFGMKMEHALEPLESWYRTEIFLLEPIIHEKFKRYRCLTKNPDVADLLYIPFYVGADFSMTRYSNLMQERDFLVQRMVGWLAAQPTWVRLQGHKHFLVMGRGIYDFVRDINASGWGNSLLANPEFQNVSKFTTERVPYFAEQMAIPYPTSFHPASDAEIELWHKTVREAKREKLVAFAGASRNLTERPDLQLRDLLFSQCESSELCETLRCDQMDCRMSPELPTKLFLRADFCLQPPGDSSTRKATFDCLVAGGIPVFFHKDAAYAQYDWHLPADGPSYSVLIDSADVMNSKVNVLDILAKIPASRIEEMHAFISREIMPRVVYDLPGAGRSLDNPAKDAFDITLEHFFNSSFQTYASSASSAPLQNKSH